MNISDNDDEEIEEEQPRHCEESDESSSKDVNEAGDESRRTSCSLSDDSTPLDIVLKRQRERQARYDRRSGSLGNEKELEKQRLTDDTESRFSCLICGKSGGDLKKTTKNLYATLEVSFYFYLEISYFSVISNIPTLVENTLTL